MKTIHACLGCISLVLLLSACDQINKVTSGGGGDGEDVGANLASAAADEAAPSNNNPPPASNSSPQQQPQSQERERGEPLVTLSPDDASLEGQAQYYCKEPWGCWWLVHCGHAICDGAWNWTFRSEGTYRLNWRGVQQKCAGSPPFQLRINDNVVTSGEIPQYGSCAQCTETNTPNIFVDQTLGTFDIEEGDKVTLWMQTDFACGIDGPGAYGAFDDIVAELVD